MDGAEYSVEAREVRRRPLERKQITRRLFHKLATFDDELFEKLVHHDSGR
jgi:hypothetical protein